MRTTQLVQVAAEAEGLRLRRKVKRAATKVAFGAVAAVFLLLSIVLLHVVSYDALVIAFEPSIWAPVFAAAIMFGIDLLFLVLFAVLATRGGADSVELEALEVRKQAVRQLGEALSMVVLLRPFMKYLPRRGVYGLVLATLTARFLGSGAGKRR